MFAKLSFHFQQARHGVLDRRHNSTMTSFTKICCMMHVDLTRSCKLLSFFCILYLKYLIIPELMLGLMHKSQFYSVINTRWLHEIENETTASESAIHRQDSYNRKCNYFHVCSCQ